MADKEFLTRIKMKRDTSSNWTKNNPVILNGEMILVDTDNGELRLKIGDGIKNYIQLPFNDEALRNLIQNSYNKDESFTIILQSTGWAGNAQTISNVKFNVNGATYIVSPINSNSKIYVNSGIYADDITIEGKITFHCKVVPSENIQINIIKIGGTV